ncbi:MAG: DUF1446 domain-containing protein [Proteobacteria bacterium]|nr:DUF1446 domain-containing protein [Pseudomonadota bacterium]
MKRVRIGSGAGYSGDRIDPAVELAEKGGIAYLGFECLAERTIALAQQERLAHPDRGYDPLLEARFRAVLPVCAAKRIRIVTNMGAANPLGAAERVAAIARELGIGGLRIAAVTGDDVLAELRAGTYPLLERPGNAAGLGEAVVSANAYLGVEGIVRALADGADIVITGRVADPALFLAPLVHEFGWPLDDWERLGKGTVVGHLLECAGQLTGGYFADPGMKSVRDLARLGFPLADVTEDGAAVVTKVAGSGGAVTLRTCKEQLLYELHDPTRYLQPDVTADFSSVRFADDGPDRVAVAGGGGSARPDTLKVSIGYRDSFVGEAQISYAGVNALARARLAGEIARERLDIIGVQTSELRCELIGVDAVHRGAGASHAEPAEVRLRVVGRTASMEDAVRLANEVETLYTNGPAGGGGVSKSAREVLAVVSTLMPRAKAPVSVSMLSC